MKKPILSIFILGILAIIAGLTGCGMTSPGQRNTVMGGIFNNQNTGIWVNGEGTVSGAPDVAILSLGVQSQAATVNQVQSEANASMNAVVSALKAGGVAEKDIQTAAFNIQQLTRYDDQTQQQVILGYQVTNTVTVKVRNVGNSGPIIDAVAAAGGNNARINSISLTIDDPTNLATQARQKAVADAKAKAKQLADTAGVKLGPATYVNESGGIIKTPPIAAAPAPAPGGSTTPISAGTLDITVNVQVIYEID
jgi:uncharacterized protein